MTWRRIRDNFGHRRSRAGRVLCGCVVFLSLLWTMSMIVGVDWPFGRQYWLTGQPGAIALVRAQWSPGQKPRGVDVHWNSGHTRVALLRLLTPRIMGGRPLGWTVYVLPYWIPLTLCAAPLVVPEIRRRGRVDATACWRCGYSTEGLTERVCPECAADQQTPRGQFAMTMVFTASIGIPLLLTAVKMV